MNSLLNKTFGRLNVKSIHHKDSKGIYYTCVCECGKEKVVRNDHLNSGVSRSCGCLQDENRKVMQKYRKTRGRPRTITEKNVLEKFLFGKYKRTAIKRNLKFNLSMEEFSNLIYKNCYYCGRPPFQVLKIRGYSNGIVYNGIDRKDNRKGYLLKNSLPCCGECNKAKLNLSYDDFIKLVARIFCNRVQKES